MFRIPNRDCDDPDDSEEAFLERCCYGNTWTEPCPFVTDPEECILVECQREFELCKRIQRIGKEECDLDMRYYQKMAEESGDDDY